MVFGPCGGVRADLGCELGDRPCPFATAPPVRWTGAPIDPAPLRVPLVLTDLTVRPYDPESVREVVGILAPVSDGLLVGEHHNRPDLPPTLFATEVLAAGGRPWTTLTCRDRNRIVLEQELVGLAALGVDGVLCVTGDARGQGVRPDVTQVFDLDGTRLASLAATLGVPAAVPEAPDAPPVGLRPARVADKQRAGAGLCVLNHAATTARISAAMAALTSAAARSPRPDASPDRLTPATPGTASSASASATAAAIPAVTGSGADSTASTAAASRPSPGKRCSTRAERSSV